MSTVHVLFRLFSDGGRAVLGIYTTLAKAKKGRAQAVVNADSAGITLNSFDDFLIEEYHTDSEPLTD